MSTFDETFDWVVVGSGAGSMSSGMLMRQAGKSVVVLEKTQFFGGTTAKSGGVMWIPNNQFMDPGEDNDEKAITYLDAVVGDDSDAPGTSHEKRLAYVQEGPKMIDFLLRQGVALERGSKFWPDYYDNLPGGCTTSRMTVISVRSELIAYYERRGYHLTGATEAFPNDPRYGIPKQPLVLWVLEKKL